MMKDSSRIPVTLAERWFEPRPWHALENGGPVDPGPRHMQPKYMEQITSHVCKSHLSSCTLVE